MKASFKKALKIFWYLSALFATMYCFYIVLDDYTFIGKYWGQAWASYLLIWFLYLVAYYIAFAFYFWLFVSLGILAYHKLLKKNEEQPGDL